MDVVALVCPRCGGPLTRPTELPALVDCVYCGTVISVGRDRAALTQEAAPHDVLLGRRKRFDAALVEALKQGTSPFDAIRAATVAHLELGAQAETAARVAIALVREFEAESGLVAAQEPLVLARIVNAYLLALDRLRDEASTEINLPFLVADASGPRHFTRTVTAQRFAELAGRDPDAAAPPVAPPPAVAPTEPAPAPEPRKKRRWWPFGG